jgi:hypothetical protein
MNNDNVNSSMDNLSCPLTNCRTFGANFNLSPIDPAQQFITLKKIQNTVRVPSSLYTNDLSALTVYQLPNPNLGVNWNQISDRRVRHIQPKLVAGGSFYHASSTKHTITRPRPNAGCPGGAGVDMKHGSYDRYLLRLKGKGSVRQGVIPSNFGKPIVFNPAIPIYGGKTMKTSIVGNNCLCPVSISGNSNKEPLLYKIFIHPSLLQFCKFVVGNQVYAPNRISNQDTYSQAVIVAVNNAYTHSPVYTVRFLDGLNKGKQEDFNCCDLLVYHSCKPLECTDALLSTLVKDNLIVTDGNGLIVENCINITNYVLSRDPALQYLFLSPKY